MENGMKEGSSKNQKQNYYIFQQSHYWGISERNLPIENEISLSNCTNWYLHFYVYYNTITRPKILDQPKCPSTDELIMWYIYTMEYYFVIKRKKSSYLQQQEWTWKTHFVNLNKPMRRKTNVTWSHLDVECLIAEIIQERKVVVVRVWRV